MQFPHYLEKGSRLAQDSARQQMRLREKRGRLQPPVCALPHHPLHVLVRDLQILQQHAFKLVAALRVLGYLSNPVQGQGHVSLMDRLAKRCGPSEIPLRQLVNLPHTELPAGQHPDKVFNVLLSDALHAHEGPQGVHVGINWKRAAEEFLPHPGAHLGHQTQPHTHPGLAPR